jgi:endonuclease YncB( thermonuclease family)
MREILLSTLAAVALGFGIGQSAAAVACDWHAPEAVDSPRIIDGDTIELHGGEKIRLLSVDAPEIWKPHCDNELDVGMKAADRLGDLLSDGAITVQRSGTDRYGRTLAVVLVDGHDVGETLVAEGFALPYHPGGAEKLARLQHWCPGAQLDY